MEEGDLQELHLGERVDRMLKSVEEVRGQVEKKRPGVPAAERPGRRSGGGGGSGGDSLPRARGAGRWGSRALSKDFLLQMNE